MSVITIQDFSGMMPLRDGILLPDRNAQYAKNTWLYKGSIRGFRRATQAYTTKYSDTKQVYRIPASTAQPPDFVNSKWLEFPDPFMATIRNPVVGDQWNRYYFFPSDQYNSTGANPDWPITRPLPKYRTYDPITKVLGPLLILGIPTPANPPIVNAPLISATHIAHHPTDLYNISVPPTDDFLALDSVANVVVGMEMADITTTTISYPTTALSPAGWIGFTFASTGGGPTAANQIRIGMAVKNTTNPSSIFSGARVVAWNATVVNIDFAFLSDIQIGDVIEFTNQDQIPSGTTVLQVIPGSTPHPSVHMSNGAVNAGIFTGDQITFTDILEERAYVYTYVSAYGEEGAASQPGIDTGGTTGTWQITIPAPAAGTTTNRNLAKIRLYRTVTDTSGNASYYQVKEFGPPFPIGVTNYSDSAAATDIVSNATLTSELYTSPPADLQGVVMMANGIMAGWSNEREIWFSAAYLPHAWPASYALTVDYPIVGLTANGASLNILCEGAPFIATGVTPDTITIGKISSNEPCISRGSVVSSGEGAYYASPNGIILLNSSGTASITEFIYEKEFHNTLQPWNWAAGHYGLSYVAFIKGSGLTGIDPDKLAIHGIVLEKEDKNTPFCYLHFTTPIRNMYFDETSGQLFGLMTNGTVMQWNPPVSTPGATTLWDWTWSSKQFRLAFPASFKAIKVIFDVPPEVTIKPGVRNIDQNQIYNPATQYLTIKVFADDKFVMVKEVQQNQEILLIPDGFKATIWELELRGQVSVTHLKMATSIKELRKA